MLDQVFKGGLKFVFVEFYKFHELKLSLLLVSVLFLFRFDACFDRYLSLFELSAFLGYFFG